MAAVKQRHKHDSNPKVGASTSTMNVHLKLPQQLEIPSPRPQATQAGIISVLLTALCASSSCVPSHPGLPLQTLRRYLLPTNLNLINCLGQPNFIYLALPATFATRQCSSNGQATLCQCRDSSTSVVHGIIFSFSPPQ